MGFCRKVMKHADRACCALIILSCASPGKLMNEAREAGKARRGGARAGRCGGAGGARHHFHLRFSTWRLLEAPGGNGPEAKQR